MLRTNAIPVTKTEKARTINHITSMVVGFIDSIDFIAIFTMFLKPFLQAFLEETGKYFMFPLAVVASIVHAGLKWWQVYLDKGDSRSTAEATVDTGAAIAITTAVVGALKFPLIFAPVTPIIFTAMVACRALWAAGSAIYYTAKGFSTPDLVERKNHFEKAKNNGISAFAGLVTLAAVVGVFLLAHPILAPLGIAAGVFGAGLILYKGISMYRESQKKKAAARSEHSPLLVEKPEMKNDLTNSAKLKRSLDLGKDTTPSWAQQGERKVSAPLPMVGRSRKESLKSSGPFGLLAATQSTATIAAIRIEDNLGLGRTP